MIPFDLLRDATSGTIPEWLVLCAILPFAGHAVARTWGPGGVAAAQRALLLVVADVAMALAFGWPLSAGPVLVALLPLVGAAAARAPASLRGHPWAWLGAVLVAVPLVALAQMGPVLWAAWWFIGLFSAAALRGLVEPILERGRIAWPELRAWWRERAEDSSAEA